MTLGGLAARIEFVLSGEVDGGDCPNCERNGIVVSETDGVYCEFCDFETDLPEVPPWI